MLDGELQILHVAVVLLHLVGDGHELLIDLGGVTFQGGDLAGSTDAGDDVLPLRVQQILAVELLFAGGGIAGEGHAGAGVVAGVAEDHRLHINRSAQVVGDALIVAVVDGALVVPTGKDRLNGQAQLRVGVRWELLGRFAPDDPFVLGDQFLQGRRRQFGVGLDARLLPLLGQGMLKVVNVNLQYHLGEHLDEAAIGVVGEALVARQLAEAGYRLIVETEVEHGVHHARHGELGAGAHGYQ